MATVNFSVLDEVKAEFDKAFGDQNKNSIIAELMRRPVRERQLQIRRERLFRKLSSTRTRRPSLTSEEVRSARAAERPPLRESRAPREDCHAARLGICTLFVAHPSWLPRSRQTTTGDSGVILRYPANDDFDHIYRYCPVCNDNGLISGWKAPPLGYIRGGTT
jgi:hypothetical protein